MTIDEAIKEFDECAKADRREQNYWAAERDETSPFNNTECIQLAEDCETRAEYNEQLAEWLMELKDLRAEQNDQYVFIHELMSELKEAKRLLKAAVEDFKEINSDILTCKYCKWYNEEADECAYCPDDVPCEKICGWKHEGEALKLIGEEEGE